MEENLIRQVGDSVVAIEPGWSSGFFVRPDLIMTAAHTLRGRDDNFEIHLRNASVIKGRIVKFDYQDDVGFISVDPISHDRKPLKISLHQPGHEHYYSTVVLSRDRGENGYMIEYQEGYWRMLLPQVEFMDGTFRENMNDFSNPSRLGFSGAPIISETGKVFGMVCGGGEFYTTAVNPIKMENHLRWL